MCSSDLHLDDLAANPRAELRAVCDLDAERLTMAARAFDVSLQFSDYEEMLASDEIDAVIIVLPDHLHREPALAALNAGKHVLLEKPMALNVHDAQAIADAAGSAKGRFMLNLSNRWMPAFAQGKELVENGEYGDVRYVFSRISNRIDIPTEKLPWLLEHSHLVHWTAIHRLDIARWWIGREVVRVRALQREGVLAAKGFKAADLYQATLEFEGGSIMNLESQWILPQSYPSFIDSKFWALCDNGLIDIDRLRSELITAGPESLDISTPLFGPMLDQHSGYTFAASRHFVDCALDGTDPLVTAADGLALTRILCAIVESCESDGQVIELDHQRIG